MSARSDPARCRAPAARPRSRRRCAPTSSASGAACSRSTPTGSRPPSTARRARSAAPRRRRRRAALRPRGSGPGCTPASASSTPAGMRGPAVDVARPLSMLAATGEVLVSRTVVDLVAGSGLVFEPRGSHTLRRRRPPPSSSSPSHCPDSAPTGLGTGPSRLTERLPGAQDSGRRARIYFSQVMSLLSNPFLVAAIW